MTWSREGPKQLWKASVGTGFSSVSVSNGLLYTMGNKDETDTVFCLDAKTGAERWKHSYPCPLDAVYYEGGTGSTPTVDQGRVFTLSKRGHLFCLEANSGKIVWQRNLLEELGVAKPRWGFAGSPMVEGDLLLLNVGSTGTAVDKQTGKVVWASGKEASGYATPVPFGSDGHRGALIFSQKALSAVDVHTGKLLWMHGWVTKWDINAADPVLIDNKVFVSSFDQGGALLDFSSGRPVEVWHNASMGNHFNSCVLVDGYLYGFNGNTDQPGPELRCLDLATGQVKWSQAGLGLGSLMVADGKLVILSEKGELVVARASPSEFKPLARAQVLGGKCWSTPVLANGRIYCRNAKGDLICLDVRTNNAS